MKASLIAMWRLFMALAFYPIIIALLIYVWVKGYHWIFGAGIIAAMLVLDPMWLRIISYHWERRKK